MVGLKTRFNTKAFAFTLESAEPSAPNFTRTIEISAPGALPLQYIRTRLEQADMFSAQSYKVSNSDTRQQLPSLTMAECRVCDKMFATVSNRNRHEKKVHPDENIDSEDDEPENENSDNDESDSEEGEEKPVSKRAVRCDPTIMIVVGEAIIELGINSEEEFNERSKEILKHMRDNLWQRLMFVAAFESTKLYKDLMQTHEGQKKQMKLTNEEAWNAAWKARKPTLMNMLSKYAKDFHDDADGGMPSDD